MENNSLQTYSLRRQLTLRDISGVKRANNGAVINDMGESVELAGRMLVQVYALLRERNIIPNAVQEQMLTSHVRTMVHRSVMGGPLPKVDASLSDEISAESMALVRDVVTEFGNLSEEGAWPLSVYFEAAKGSL